MAESIVNLFNSETVFSFTFFLSVLGLGYFIQFSFWPWWREHQNTKQRMQHEINLKEVEIEVKRQDRWDTVISTIAEFKEELGAFRASLEIIMAYLLDDWMEKSKPPPDK